MAETLGPLRPNEEKLFKGQPKSFPLGDFNLEDVMLPEGEDFGIASDDDSIGDEEIETETGFGSVIVADNLPRVTPEKLEKLQNVIKKIFGQIGTIREGGVYLPEDPETKMTLGYAFIEYSSPQEAQAAQLQTNSYKLDKNHIFMVSMFDDFEKYAKVPEEYALAEKKPYVPRENLHEWCIDKRGRDQFAIRYLEETEIFYNDAQRSLPEAVYKRNCWTELFVQWSPHGSYIATLHRQGVAIWGGTSFQRLMRWPHPGVQLIQFSPEENYLVTFSSVEPSNPRDPTTLILNIFDVKTGAKLRNFQVTPEDVFIHPGGLATNWPIFKWAGGCDDKYFARLGRNQISVYETPDCTLLDKKSIKLENVQDFQWSPSAPILSACQAEQSSGNLPARIVLLRMPERTELRQKNLFSVSEVAMFWHPQGDHLAVKVDRFTKTRKSTYTSFELFSVKERDIPMEVLDLPNKADKVVDFAWEPKGSRFAMLHGDGPRPAFSLYAMKDMKTSTKGVQLIGTQLGKQANTIHWSPQGRYLVLAGLKGMQGGQLEFISGEDLEVLNAAEHFLASEIQWDPTGRYVATCVTAVQQMENGLNMWLFNGQLIYRLPKEKLFQFMWRPRPPSMLTKEQEEDILKNLRKYSRKYDEEDAQIMSAADTEIIAERNRLEDEWMRWYASKQEWLAWIEDGRKELLGDKLQEGEYTVEEVEAEVPMGPPQEEVVKL